jgi:type IV pilus assembly protein PilE
MKRNLSTQKARGFTLIEVLIVVAIIGILTAIAMPSYSAYLIRARLPEAASALADYRVRMEQFYADNRSYSGGAACGVVAPTNYESFVVTCTTTGQDYVATASGKSGSPVVGFTYTVNQANLRTTTSWGASWGAVPAAGATAWLLRK